ncbi:uncharacterized protein LOC133872247 isoform X2 [Alnus glutinosa]|uniref:uncharacterized protein LOC133872247 isoform X2 n=1 Tax=Alnus glutinosa TaxID=3517 RepID=UPI002D79FFC6|nr:uncharacterized protein LOC133872247 isoform X2 [Alnus glutinosa]
MLCSQLSRRRSLENGREDEDTFANFFMYDVQNCSWEILDPVRRKVHANCRRGQAGKALAVGDYLYWIVDAAHLLAYNFESDLWLAGDINGLNILTHEYLDSDLPGLFHLEKERFCIIHTAINRYPRDSYVQCILFDVFPMPELKSLRISFVSTIKYKTSRPTSVLDSFLMS